MSRRLLLGLVLAVALVAVAVQWQGERERRGDFDYQRGLLEGVQYQRIKEMWISNITRGADLGLQVDANGAWYIIDPVAYRADAGVMGTLRQIIEGNLALRPPHPDLDHGQIGLDPPRAEWVITELVDGEARVHRILVGDPDPTGNRVYVLQGGELFLTSRNLATTLDREFPDYRSRRISELDPARVHEVQRTGRVQHDLEDEPYDLELSALREGASWRSLRPFEAALDPIDVSLVVVGAGRLSFEHYIEEPDVDLGVYGLANPELRIELKAGGGASEVLFLGRPGVGGRWFCRREGTDDVYGVSMRDAILLTYPSDAMVDLRLHRVAADEVSAVRLESLDGVVRLAREGAGWTVSDGAEGPVPAEAIMVRTLLAWLAEAELLPFGDGPSLDVIPPPARRLVLEVSGGELGGEVGGRVPAESGDVVWYRRFGDEVVGRLDAEVLSWLDRPASGWWSLSLMELDELAVSGLKLTHGDSVLRFERGERGRWRNERGREVTELLPLLDPLLFLRATERAKAEGAAPLDDIIEVSFELGSGELREFIVGVGAKGGAECEIGAVRAVLLRGDLHQGLSALFR